VLVSSAWHPESRAQGRPSSRTTRRARRGRGAIVEDVDGNTFLDFAAGIAVVSTGHCHPEVVAAIQEQAAELIHMSGTDFYYPSLVELAEKLGAPICFHPAASPNTEQAVHRFKGQSNEAVLINAFRNPIELMFAVGSFCAGGVLERFPKLRVAFLEAGSEWTVRLIKGLRQRKSQKIDQWLAERVFVSCAMDDDLPYIIGKNGDDFLITATDFPHGDAFRQDQLAIGLKARGDLTERTIEKILSENPHRLYHI